MKASRAAARQAGALEEAMATLSILVMEMRGVKEDLARLEAKVDALGNQLDHCVGGVGADSEAKPAATGKDK